MTPEKVKINSVRSSSLVIFMFLFPIEDDNSNLIFDYLSVPIWGTVVTYSRFLNLNIHVVLIEIRTIYLIIILLVQHQSKIDLLYTPNTYST